MIYFAGCNHYINSGRNEYEPVGTALSMHECGDCEKLSSCKLKKETEVWKYNDDIAKQMKDDWEEMNEVLEIQRAYKNMWDNPYTGRI